LDLWAKSGPDPEKSGLIQPFSSDSLATSSGIGFIVGSTDRPWNPAIVGDPFHQTQSIFKPALMAHRNENRSCFGLGSVNQSNLTIVQHQRDACTRFIGHWFVRSAELGLGKSYRRFIEPKAQMARNAQASRVGQALAIHYDGVKILAEPLNGL
jgi:hypothetical protein